MVILINIIYFLLFSIFRYFIKNMFNQLLNQTRISWNLPKLDPISIKTIISALEEATNDLFPTKKVSSLQELRQLLDTNYLEFVNRMHQQGKRDIYKKTTEKMIEEILSVLKPEKGKAVEVSTNTEIPKMSVDSGVGTQEIHPGHTEKSHSNMTGRGENQLLWESELLSTQSEPLPKLSLDHDTRQHLIGTFGNETHLKEEHLSKLPKQSPEDISDLI